MEVYHLFLCCVLLTTVASIDPFDDNLALNAKTRCVEKSCQNGRCDVTANEQEVCACYEGFELVGDYCRKLNCTNTPCEGGMCIVRRNSREECVCPPGHSLRNGVCIRGACSMHTCVGGACRVMASDSRLMEGELLCICPKGYSLQGIGCFPTMCKNRKCWGGLCHVDPDSGEEICTCPANKHLFVNMCQINICEKPCFGGTCKRVNGTEVCECPSGYVLFDGVCRGK